MFSTRYIKSSIKKYDGIDKGSSILWAARMSKGYGHLPEIYEHNKKLTGNEFDYSEEQISIARNFRIKFYQRILKPSDIAHALRYSPVHLEIEIFSCIFNDKDGLISLPDPEEDKKEDMSHALSVIGYQKDGLKILNNWPNWGNRGVGFIPKTYINKYFNTAFVYGFRYSGAFFKKGTVDIGGKKYFFHIFIEQSFLNDGKIFFNIEVKNHINALTGWAHYKFDKNQTEIWELFVLKEYRQQGIGSFILTEIINHAKDNEITGYVPVQDLIGNRDEIVKSFFIKNGFAITLYNGIFKDCRNKIIKLSD